ncbi:hypothetical protein [Sphingomicrobium marinum]|uniref:hypothetical protein n=1 Tax=Sphingomicrobium marinum TaxID=1227950 RepID=UPI00224018DA|nr:hypothetical protein [Sphingomicrobium marinum]
MLWFSFIPVSALLAAASLDNHHEHRVKIEQAAPVDNPALPGGPAGKTEIRVSGKLGGQYDTVENDTLRFWLRVWQPGIPNYPVSQSPATFHINGYPVGLFSINRHPQVFEVETDYRDMRDKDIPSKTVSPISLCNDKLARLSGEELRSFQRDGGEFYNWAAYNAIVEQIWRVRKHRLASGRNSTETKRFVDSTPLGVTIICEPLGAPTPVGKPSNAVSKVALRAAAMGSETIGRQSCPDKVRLYATIEARHRTKFKVLMRGPKFLTPPKDLLFGEAGSQSVTETFDVRWDATIDELATTAGKRPDMQQKLNFHVNVADEQGRLLKTAETSIVLQCNVPPKPARVRLPGT